MGENGRTSCEPTPDRKTKTQHGNHHDHNRRPSIYSRPGQSGGSVCREKSHQRPTDDVLQHSAAEIPVGLRSLQKDEGEPLGAGGYPDAERLRALARHDRPHLRGRAVDHQDGDRVFLRGRGDRRGQHPPRDPRGGDGTGAEARARAARARGKHPRGFAGLHDQLARDQPARVRGDVRGRGHDQGQDRLRGEQ